MKIDEGKFFTIVFIVVAIAITVYSMVSAYERHEKNIEIINATYKALPGSYVVCQGFTQTYTFPTKDVLVYEHQGSVWITSKRSKTDSFLISQCELTYKK